jgi:hypothetical protein
VFKIDEGFRLGDGETAASLVFLHFTSRCFKSEWRKRGLLRQVQLTISGCVGPCDVPNVVVVTSSSGAEWVGNIDRFEEYRSLVEWAARCKDAGEMQELPKEFRARRINPFIR